jgi:hypothetical protein
MNEQRRPECVVEAVPEDPSHPDGATDMYLIFDGRRIAKRGKPGTPHAMTWISLEPGVVVRDVPMPESESGWGMVMCVCIDKHRFYCHAIHKCDDKA